MSSKGNSSKLRALYAAFDRHPRVEAALEVFFNIIVGFAPFLIIAIAKSKSNSEIQPIFWSFFSAGELIISLFSTCAAVLWVTFFRPKNTNAKLSKFLILISVILGILFSGVVIGENVGFENDITIYNQNKILFLYVVSLFIWFLVSIANTGGSDEQPEDPTRQIDRKYFGQKV